ncbi:phosphopantetheine-binding protein [Pseudoalteromonas sp. OOF1S-7]|uniref:acyl carrier protein n=1 Tax=Pseudoalteromonas sp. OOF1S-7 TaxID=2917757 RepID=UPI001EF6A72F|nr:phosphopantetheine-binding protein [Pseudoalteromonas sp. OOF1S-7]MCG7534493.1 phosphopantetheine-binding protein [Pseudoalteromonas sp. OOF1S-7]
MSQAIVNTVRQFLEEYIRVEKFENDENIFAKKYVNSLFAMQLILFIEKSFGIKVENEDLDIDNFSSVNAITDFVSSKSTV